MSGSPLADRPATAASTATSTATAQTARPTQTPPTALPAGQEGPGTVVVLEPMSSGEALVKAATDLGFEVVVASFDAEDRTLSPPARRAGTVVRVDTNDDRALDDAVLAAVAGRRVAAVLPGFEFYVPAAARLAARLGRPALPVRAAEACRDKELMRGTVAAAGLRVPRHAVAATAADLAAAADQVGFPCVVKPTRSAGSVHVTRADTLADLRAAHRRMADDPRRDLGRALDGRVLVEEYIAGPEVSAEGYVTDGRSTVVAVTRKMLGPEPFFVETGHLVPADLTAPARAKIDRYVATVTAALGVTTGPFHCELRLAGGRDPVLIELGARLPGDHIVDLVEAVTGVSLPRAAVALAAGLDADVAVRAPQAKHAGIRFFTAPGLASYSSVRGLDAVGREPGVWDVEVAVAPGESIAPAEDFRCRLGHVLFVADSAAEAEQRWHHLGEQVRFD
ncbi:ATP-grasp domain-containing protein [Frankia sp. Mgl5]|uniref:ATP-grasp domain-containing protein n=1 Tax=Frankia sp. Mgl5 TaxID=2933793 RepID=UPI0020106B00|nr:ATP-grasp domain-containing protein [Frankia sp. Mgl5]MCK9932732.1 ATP-grasp domain-containing protein [Frankia sp. Mgl5]